MSMQPFIGFQPDVDPMTPGVITDCNNLLPTVKGFKALPSYTATDLPALAAACQGAVVVVKLDGTSRLIAGTATKLYEGAASSWTDRSRAGNYSVTSQWRFAQFGDTTLATNKADTLQASSGAAFADIAGAPKASVMDAAAGFVMLAATNDGTYGDQADRWWCSSYQDATSGTAWTPSVTTQCTTGRLVDSPGPIMALKALGSNFVAYKQKSMFIAGYVGAPSVFNWLQIPGEIGCSSQEAVVNIGSAHLFIGYENIYMFDGSRPVPIGNEVKEWFFGTMNNAYRYLICGMHEKAASRVWFFFPSGASQTLNSAIVYNYTKGTWGKVTLSIERPVEYLSGGITWDGLGALYSTFNDLPNLSFDSPFWTQSTLIPSVVDATHTLQNLTGVSAGCSITCGDLGDDTQLSMLSRSRPRFIVAPTSGTMTNYYRDQAGAALSTDATSAMNSGKFDVLRTARWHRLKYDFVGDCEIVGDAVSLVPAGFA